ncbi:hemerythrin HHE cation binding domain-containing protein [Aspergillus egyptiacus]|nr:hemerythrin HHE cation binding domain-containing protein [Aspergillus egyptiacus]
MARISETLKQDHREIEAIADRIIRSTSRDDQIRYQNLFTWELARHAVGEELVVYPAFEKHVPDGARLAEKDRKEHQHVKTQLKTFQQLDPSHHEFLPKLTALMDDLEAHIKEEESQDLPMLEDAVSEAESRSLSKSFSRTKIFLPSRAHPHVPNKPPFETAVGLLTAPFDQLADLFRKWPRKDQIEG